MSAEVKNAPVSSTRNVCANGSNLGAVVVGEWSIGLGIVIVLMIVLVIITGRSNNNYGCWGWWWNHELLPMSVILFSIVPPEVYVDSAKEIMVSPNSWCFISWTRTQSQSSDASSQSKLQERELLYGSLKKIDPNNSQDASDTNLWFVISATADTPDHQLSLKPVEINPKISFI